MSKLLHGLILFATFVVTVVIVLLIYRPDIVEKWWLWVIGLAAPAAAWVKAIKEKIEEYLADLKKSKQTLK
jgi:predicted DNA-binding transcriptional regulator